jgi:hypothetical protein
MTTQLGITIDHFKKLAAPFAAKEHEFNPRGFIYIEETALCQRIEQVDLSWEWRVEAVNRYDPKGMIATTVGHLTICGVTRSGEGSQMVEFRKGTDIESGEVEKGSETDALKRAARKFGIGRYLLDCPKEVKGYGRELDTWLRDVARAQGTPQIAPPSFQSAPAPTVTADILRYDDAERFPRFLVWAQKTYGMNEAQAMEALYAINGAKFTQATSEQAKQACETWHFAKKDAS